MQNWTGENVKFWINTREKRNGEKFNTYAISVGKKLPTGDWVYKSARAFISNDIDVRRYRNGDLVDFSGFPTLDVYTDRDGKEHAEFAVFISSMNPHGAQVDSFEEADDDIPF